MKAGFKLLLPFAILIAITCCRKDAKISNSIRIEIKLQNLQIPWGMAFLPNGDLIFCQLNGKIGLLKSGATDYTVLMQRTGLVTEGEGGLLGLTLDPNYSSNHYMYIYETTTTASHIVRLVYQAGTLTEDQVILEGIPQAKYHNGGGLHFGPDGYLYIGTGDARVTENAQDKNSLSGKILRIDRNGNAAPGNPFNNYVYTYGHRNVQGFDWNEQGKMISTEHGPTGEFNLYAHDEINLIEPGKNYGWPLAIGGKETDSLTPAIIQSGDDTWAPSGGTFIRGEQWGSWKNSFIVGALRGERLVRFTMDGNGTKVVSVDSLFSRKYGRLRNIINAPDGSLWFNTSNYGSTDPMPLAGDDKIYRITAN